VNKPVDNCVQVRITTAVLWIRKNSQLFFRWRLRGARPRSRNTFTVGNGHHPGATPGTWEELGNRHLARVFGPGGRRETGTTRGQLRERGRNWETGILRGCLAPAVVGKRAPPGGNSGNVGGTGKPAPPAGVWPWRSAAIAGQAGRLASLVRQAEQGPLQPIFGGGLVLLCPTERLRPLTTRRQKSSKWTSWSGSRSAAAGCGRHALGRGRQADRRPSGLSASSVSL
jgi:hypothetical protein